MEGNNNLVADSSIDCGLKENDTGVNTNKNKTLTSITRVSKKMVNYLILVHATTLSVNKGTHFCTWLYVV